MEDPPLPVDHAPEPACVACGMSDRDVPLLDFAWRGGRAWICSRHLPVLIHDPARLADRLEGAGSLRPAEHRD